MTWLRVLHFVGIEAYEDTKQAFYVLYVPMWFIQAVRLNIFRFVGLRVFFICPRHSSIVSLANRPIDELAIIFSLLQVVRASLAVVPSGGA